MYRRICLKFRDDLPLKSLPTLLSSLEVPPGYDEALKLFIEEKKQDSPNGNEKEAAEVKRFVETLKNTKAQFKKIKPKSHLDFRPRYLYYDTPLEVFNRLKISLDETRAKKQESKHPISDREKDYVLPNFYHSFEIRVPNTLSEKELEQTLAVFEDFVPAKTGGDSRILEYAYIKYPPTQASPYGLSEAWAAGGNQDYFKDMDVPVAVIQSLDARDVYVGIVELEGWNLSHNEFEGVGNRVNVLIDQNHIMVNPGAHSLPPTINILSTQNTWDDDSHGNKTLGILISKADSSKTGRGTEPPVVDIATAKMVLFSYLDDGSETSQDSYRITSFKDQNALVRLLDHFTSHRLSPATQLNEIVLVEVAKSGGFLPNSNSMLAHGKKGLSMDVDSFFDSGQPDRKGLLPPMANLVLSSSIVEGTKKAGGRFRITVFNDENALARLLFHLTEQKLSNNRLSNQIILLELATHDDFPLTTYPEFAHLVKAASMDGHTVIVPAGNPPAPEELKKRLKEFYNKDRNKIDLFLEDSKDYLLVGAAVPGLGSGSHFMVEGASNWGKDLVSIYAQGANVLTTHHIDDKYDLMGNTSAASAIIAGVAGILQAYARQKLGRPLYPNEIREILQKDGKPVFKDGDEVGQVPNVAAALLEIDNM